MPLIEKHKEKGNIFIFKGKSFSASLVKMMLAERIDYIVEYPWVAGYYQSELGGKKDDLISMQIEELKDNQYIWAGAACPKNEWGKKIINRINEILRKEIPTERWRGFVERWLDKNAIPEYRKAYERIILNQVQK